MARMIPERMLDFDPASREDVVFNALKGGLGEEYVVFHSLNVNQMGAHDVFYEKEIDFLVYHREKGILCLEVKNGSAISYCGGEWRYSSGRPMKHGGPFKQAQLERIAICNLLQRRGEEYEVLNRDPRFREIASRCKVVWGVWFHGMGRSSVNALALPPEVPRERILTLEDLDAAQVQSAIDRLFDVEVPNYVQTNLSAEDADWLLDKVLAPTVENLCPTPKDGARFAEIVYAQLIAEQARVLDFLEGQKSAVINGMAGTGKTFVALERTRRCAARGERTLYLCFNTALRDFLKADFAATSPACAKFVDFLTLDDFVGTFSGPLPSTEKLRQLLKEEVAELQLGRYRKAADALLDQLGTFAYTQVIVDEGQDCAIGFIEESGLMETLREVVVAQENPTGHASAFFMFYDAFQIVSLGVSTKAELPHVIRDADCKLTLYKNCRNTCSIAQSAAKGILASGKTPEMAAGALVGKAPEIHFVDPEASFEVLARTVTEVLADLRTSFRPDEIVVLSCAPGGTGYSRLEERVKDKSDGTRVFNQVYPFSTYRRFKGLDAAAVVLVDVDRSAFVGTHGAMPFYEAASRARQKLVIVASLDEASCGEILAALSPKERKTPDAPIAGGHRKMANFLGAVMVSGENGQ